MKTLAALLVLSLFGCANPVDSDATQDNATTQQDDDMYKKSNASTAQLSQGGSAVLNLQEVFAEPEVYTLQFTIYGQQPKAPPNPIIAEADISWKVEGNSIERRVTVANGLSISAPCLGVSVRVHDVSAPVFGPFPSPAPTYQVTAAVTRGVRATTAVPPMLEPTMREQYDLGPNHGIAPASTYDVVVPSNVGVNGVQVLVNPPPGGLAIGAAVVQQKIGVVVVKEYILTGTLQDALFVPVVAGVDTLTLINATVANTLYFAVVFGIDG